MAGQNITIDGIVLDRTYNPYINFTYEYFSTSTGEIIGGVRVFTISGTVSKSTSSSSGSQVMRELKTIRNIGRNAKCVSVVIGSLYSGPAKISNVTIDQGDDPSWINQAPFTIEIRAPLDNIPSNSLGIVASDRAKEVSRSESLEIGEDAHGFVYSADGSTNLSKTFVKWSSQITITCESLCSVDSPQTLAMNLLNKLLLTAPDSDILSDYKTWKPHSQSRSLELIGINQVSFSADIVLLPPDPSSQFSAFIDLEFEQDRSFQDNQESKRIKGTITGLSPISWSDLIDLDNTSTHSKLDNAENAFDYIKNKYNKLYEWRGGVLELNINKAANCPIQDNNSDNNNIVKPKTSSISKSRTEGTITFTFEWGTNQGECTDDDGLTREVTVDITEPARQIVEHVIPSVGTLIQDLNCCTAKKISFTSSISAPEADGLCPTLTDTDVDSELNRAIDRYIGNENLNKWLLINHTRQTTLNSVSTTKEFIEACIDVV